MAQEAIADALDQCIEDMRSGRATLEDCLIRHPELRDDLEPLLRIATNIVPLTVTLDPSHRLAARAHFVEALYARPERPGVHGWLRRILASAAPSRFEALSPVALALDECLEQIREGRSSLEQCLTRYPALRSNLEPLLRIAVSISAPIVAADPAQKLAARARFVEALYAEPKARSIAARLRELLSPATPLRFGLPGTISLALALTLVASTGAVYASEQAIPGEPLHGVKLALEQVRVAAARDDESRIGLYLEIAARRLAEVERAIDAGNPEAVQAAAERYVQRIEAAEERLAKLPRAEGQRALERLEKNLERQRSMLARVADRAPQVARDSLEQARSHAERGLDRVAAAGSPSQPGPESAIASGTSAAAPPPGASAPSTASPIGPDGRSAAGATSPSSDRGRPSDQDRGRSTGLDRTARPERGRQAPTEGTRGPARGRPAPDERPGPDAQPTGPPSVAVLREDTATQLERLQRLAEQVDRALSLLGRREALSAKLEAAESALARGQAEAARNQLEAFRNQLETLGRDGRISEATYRSLLEGTRALHEAMSEGQERGRPGRPGSPHRAPPTFMGRSS